jgi:hypothetical protein
MRTAGRVKLSGVLVRTPDRKQAGSTTAPRSGDGDRPQGDPEGVSAQRE